MRLLENRLNGGDTANMDDHDFNIVYHVWTYVLSYVNNAIRRNDFILVMDSSLDSLDVSRYLMEANARIGLQQLPVYDVANENDRSTIIRLLTHMMQRRYNERPTPV